MTVSAKGLRVVYRDRTVVDVPEVTLPAGETYVLLGASGAGKSTLLRALGLLERPTAGEVYYDGKRASGESLSARRRIAAVFQKPYLLRGTVADNVAYGLRMRGVRRSDRVRRVAEALERVELGGWEKRSALTLSGGEAQRVALARALVLRPSVLLLDEPLSYLDPLLRRELSAQFAQILASERVTTLYVTHDKDEAAAVADRIGVMRDGRIVEEGDRQAVLVLPRDPWVATFVGTEPPLRGTVGESSDGLATIDCGGMAVTAQAEIEAGTEVLLGVRPEDVVLFEDGMVIPEASDRNRFGGIVTGLCTEGVTTRATVETQGGRLSASLSSSSVAPLGLAIGSPVTLVFRASAVMVERR